MPTSLTILAALAIGYLLGSIPFGLLLTRFAGLGDVRAIGSGNIGATNVLRTGRRDVAAATLVADCLKGTVAVLIAGALFGFGSDGAMVAGLGAFLGHIFPVWLKFKGGKGVATYLGVLLGLAWPAALIFAVVWIATAWFTRYSSLSALVASLVTPPVLIFLLGDNRIGGLFVVLTVILWWRHAENIRRLAARTESRIGGGK
ncbi:MAG: glycerol-3-phosphate 1-O-acyltransferase PlsY [Bauldia sp.]|uniref:glycerol-3-phosphate 1-O-acyltransferase PlsY n=1 Tax=Bauldia sp. TaxID=2575872 RepID=UPI001DB52DC5|nr:glycerol-3-phosphate 1-O-acyltransferase PlsY [Bauldia sp.]MCB1498067.1 glycerol-3-phosphate 1-O-acyltransferase PlsY [Bauldia sp.]